MFECVPALGVIRLTESGDPRRRASAVWELNANQVSFLAGVRASIAGGVPAHSFVVSCDASLSGCTKMWTTTM
jgi:hypothetical protein